MPMPLARFLPPLPAGMGAAWLRAHLPPGSWALDPFGASPRLALEMARAGYRALVAANNPVIRFLLETMATPPRVDELSAALAALSAARTGDERLEPHILGLYETECAQCRRTVSADAFLWARQAQVPYARIYRCPHCGDSGERPATEQDAANAARFAPERPSTRLHRARALARIAPLNDPDRPHAEEALNAYLPRAVYALFALISKLDGLGISAYQRRLLGALLLTALDQANTLWPHPTARARPRQLVVPPHFREHNVWRALEEAVTLWAQLDLPATPLTIWPELPDAGGICLFEGRLKQLAETVSGVDIAGIVTALPRQNQAFWTLSALWAGWLWGRAEMGPFKSVLRRRRYDWAWQTAALKAALGHLAGLLPANTPAFMLVGEAEPGFISAAFLSGGMAGLTLEGAALRGRVGQARWRVGDSGNGGKGEGESARGIPDGTPAKLKDAGAWEKEQVAEILRGAARAFLLARGEPSPYLPLHTAALAALVQAGALPVDEPPARVYAQVSDWLEKRALTYGGGFLRHDGRLWWLRDAAGARAPLSDRVEEALARYLAAQHECAFQAIEHAMRAAFPGLHTPARPLVSACLESYGKQDGAGRWRLRPQEVTQARAADVEEIHGVLHQIGTRLGYRVQGRTPVLWTTPRGKIAAIFYVQTAARLGKIAKYDPVGAIGNFIVVPGGRANLIAFKQQTNPALAGALEGRWQFLKFRLLRRLASSPALSQKTLLEQLGLDPLTYSAPQMKLL